MDPNTDPGLEPKVEQHILGQLEIELAQETLDQNMGISDVKRVFQNRASGKLNLDDAQLNYSGDKQTLSLTGQFPDGTPFTLSTAPFQGDPVQKAKQIATDLTMPAPVNLKVAAGELRNLVQVVKSTASQLVEDAKREIGDFNTAVGEVRETLTDIRAGTAEMKAALGLGSNGGPPLDGGNSEGQSSPP